MDKIIFLDIDGVLNSAVWRTSVINAGLDPEIWISPELVENLNTIIQHTGAKVVVSSDWRRRSSVQELQSILDSVFFKGTVIDLTAELNIRGAFSEQDFAKERNAEIALWLEGRDGITVKSWVALDDLPLGVKNFVRTSHLVGLTDDDVAKAIAILNG